VIIMGIDPGSRVTGYGVVEIRKDQVIHLAHGAIVMETSGEFSDRMLELGEALQEVFKKYRPQQVSIESIFLGKNADSAFKLGHARGVALYESRRAGATVFEYATRLVKKGMTGRGSAQKEEVQAFVQKVLGLRQVKPLDASDALAIAVHHAYRAMHPFQMTRAKASGRPIDL
jgi:crossover junction endodeoxyribonuclease RuvC